jgi:hypothetical protein
VVLDFRNAPLQGVGESPSKRSINCRTKTLMPQKETLLVPRGKMDNIVKNVDYLLFYVPLKNCSLIYGDVIIGGEGLQNLGL